MTSRGPRIRWIEHTADAGFRVWARAPEEVYRAAVEALATLLFGEVLPEPEGELAVSVPGDDRAERLVGLLDEVLYRVEVHGFATLGLGLVEEGESGLTARLLGRQWDPEALPLLREVKAATYHGLGFEARDGGFEATVILDL